MAELVTQPIPPVPSSMGLSQNGEIVSQPWQQWFVNLRDKINIINGILVQISGTATPAATFDLLSPLTTEGDMLIYSGGHNIRLGIGATGDTLTVTAGLPTWGSSSNSGGILPIVTGEIVSGQPVFVILDDGSLVYGQVQ